MNRGVLSLTAEELDELVKFVSLEKLNIAILHPSQENKIFLNEDELEKILDEIGAVTDNQHLFSTREKISSLLLSFRK